jgi:hypothetical protein
MIKNLTNKWMTGVPKGDKEASEARRRDIEMGEPALRVLAAFLTKELESLRKQQTAKQDYEQASWAYNQADFNGSIRQLEKILDSMPFDY